MSNPLVANPITGFLESPSPHDICPERNYFNSDRKQHFLALIDECIDKEAYPHLKRICDTVGISQKAFERHLKWDKAFREEWEERKAQLRSVFTVKLAIKADSKMGTLANLAILRYLESGTWLPETRINHMSDGTASKSFINAIPTVIDAEIADNSPDIPSVLPSQGDTQK